jgi:protein phosphatase
MFYYGQSDVGMHRKINEDSYWAENMWGQEATLLVVCDGMGGHKAGEVASRTAVETFCDMIISSPCLSYKIDDVKEELRKKISLAVKEANTKIYNLSKKYTEMSGMGTTLVAAIEYKGLLVVANIGDSRMYISTPAKTLQLSHDHSYVQHLIDSNIITKEEAKSYPRKNVITRAVGIGPQAEVDIFFSDLKTWGNGYLLLCSDGLSNYVSEKDISNTFNRASKIDPGPHGTADLEFAVHEFITAANNGGGADNITALTARYSI